jgi:glycosyltransferase involved in cell wall biosynthesis
MMSRPLKLALVTRRYPPLIGGAERVFSYLADALAAEGADVTVLTSQTSGSALLAQNESLISPPKNGGPRDDIVRCGLTIVQLETSRLRFWGTWRYMRQLRRWFQAHTIDLAYVSMLKHDAYAVIGAAAQHGFPVVLRPEGAGATGDVAWQSWGNFGRMIGRRCRQADAFIAISKSIEGELQQAWQNGTMRSSRSNRPAHHAQKSPRIVAIPNGVPIPESAWQCRPDWRSAPQAIFVGRLAPEKGLDVLVNAWPAVRAKYPQARLIMIGEGPERPALEARTRRAGLTIGPGQAVNLPGAAGNPVMAQRQADLFILPSREEGMSIALLEAMALGMPLVASSIPGNHRLLQDFQHGRLAPVADAEGLARVIIDQWDDFDRAIEMGRAARSRVEQEFSIQAVARQHLSLFQQIVEEHRRSR